MYKSEFDFATRNFLLARYHCQKVNVFTKSDLIRKHFFSNFSLLLKNKIISLYLVQNVESLILNI